MSKQKQKEHTTLGWEGHVFLDQNALFYGLPEPPILIFTIRAQLIPVDTQLHPFRYLFFYFQNLLSNFSEILPKVKLLRIWQSSFVNV